MRVSAILLVILSCLILSTCTTTQPASNSGGGTDTSDTASDYPGSEDVGAEPISPLYSLTGASQVFAPNISTVKCHLKRLPLTKPVLNLYSGQQIVLSFDDLEGDVKDYYYTVIHCNYDWKPSDLNPYDYIEGFTREVISDYKYSSQVTQSYTHYELAIPNGQFNLTKSGNYILKVYANNDPEQVVILQRIMIVDNQVSIQAEVTRPGRTLYRDTHQDISFVIKHPGITISNPFDETNVIVMQNQRWDHAKIGIKPQFVRGEELVYDYQEKLLFPAGKEWRWFDITSLRYQKERIKMVEYYLDTNRVFIVPDPIRSYEQYFYHRDINGQFMVNVQENTNPETQSDYAKVYFTLPFEKPLSGGDLYVYGAMTNWSLMPEAKMVYNFERKAYESALFLKQGYYNYVYILKEENEQELDMGFIEGNYFEAENEYTILFYYRPFGARYDQLIGTTTVNSLF